jgi:hypothetical protein
MRTFALAGAAALSLGALASAADAQAPYQVDCAAPPAPAIVAPHTAAEDTPTTLKAAYGYPGCDAAGDEIETTIEWGDGSSSPAVVTPKAGEAGIWDVSADHTYRDTGHYKIVLHSRNVRTGVARDTAGNEIDVGPGGTKTLDSALKSRAGKRFNGKAAIVTMGGGRRLSSDYAATIAWGDGTSTKGHVSIAHGELAVTGRHTYRRAARGLELTITVKDKPAGGVLKLKRPVRVTA